MCRKRLNDCHYCDVTMDAIASLITSLTSVYSTVHPGADQRKHKSSASLAFVRGIHRRSVNFPHKRPVTRKMFPFDDVIMSWIYTFTHCISHISQSFLIIKQLIIKFLIINLSNSYSSGIFKLIQAILHKCMCNALLFQTCSFMSYFW